MKLSKTTYIKVLFTCLACIAVLNENAFSADCKKELTVSNKAEFNLKRVNRTLVRTDLQLVRASKQLEKYNELKELVIKQVVLLKTEQSESNLICSDEPANPKCKIDKRLPRKILSLDKRRASLEKVIIRKEKVFSFAKARNDTSLELLENAQSLLDASKENYLRCANDLDAKIPAARSFSYNFDSLALGSDYGIGKSFGDNYLRFDITPFTYQTGAVSSGDFAKASVNYYSQYFTALKSQQIGLWLGNINIKIQTANKECATKVSFDYLDGGGVVNLTVNNEQFVGENLVELNHLSLGNGAIERKVTNNFNNNSQNLQDQGRLEITGSCIKEVRVGGQEFLIDNVELELASTK